MATKTIFLTGFRNANNITLVNNDYLRAIPVYFDYSNGGITGSVISSVTITLPISCSHERGVTLAMGSDQLRFTLPSTGGASPTPSSPYQKTITLNVTGFTNNTFASVGGTSNMAGDYIDGDDDRTTNYTYTLGGDGYLTVNYYAAESTFIIPSSVKTGISFPINIQAGSSDAAHKILLQCGASGTEIDLAAGETSTTTVIPDSWLAIGDTVTVTLQTLAESTVVGETSKTMTLTAGPSSGPQFDMLVEPNIPTSLVGVLDTYTQSVIGAHLKMSNISGQYGATIVSSRISIDGTDEDGTYISGTTESALELANAVIGVSGTLTVRMTAKDSRGITTTKTQEITVNAYSKPQPTATGFMAWRVDSSGQESTTGKYGCGQYAWTYDPLNGKNTVTSKLQIQDSGTWYDLTAPENGTVAVLTDAIGNYELDTVKSYTLRLTLTDLYSSWSYDFTIPSAAYVRVVDRAKNSMGFYMAPEHENAVEFGADVYIKGQSLEDYVRGIVTKVVAGGVAT
jgi:hypothetical protein